MEKGVEKIGEKTGKLIGEKIYDKFSSKKTQPPETGKYYTQNERGRNYIHLKTR